ncbi:MAG TPA: MBL fold metallo-hydrolase [Candidatus Thermoplasmatota archaeon]|nr:MBL fold metallo-hydrolase [Candidatus Thermoplasmatota archaeon]
MFVAQRIAGHMANFTYLVGDPATKRALLIDPSFDATVALRVAEQEGFAVEAILDTHEHYDHCQDNALAKHRTGAPVMAHRLADVPAKDRDLEDGEVVRVGELKVKVYHTPGHSPGSVVYVAGKHSFTGDTLFVGNIGRIDLPHSSPGQMYDSLHNVVRKLDPDVVVNPGHDYGPTPTSTIGRELRENPYVQPMTREEFVRVAL